MLGRNYKRNYRFRTDTSKEKRYMNIVIIIALILLILWYIFY